LQRQSKRHEDTTVRPAKSIRRRCRRHWRVTGGIRIALAGAARWHWNHYICLGIIPP